MLFANPQPGGLQLHIGQHPGSPTKQSPIWVPGLGIQSQVHGPGPGPGPLVVAPVQPHSCLQESSSFLQKKFWHSIRKVSLLSVVPSLFASKSTVMSAAFFSHLEKTIFLHASFFTLSKFMAEEKGLKPTPYIAINPSRTIIAIATITKTLTGKVMALDIIS
jgi:hypothetical protein